VNKDAYCLIFGQLPDPHIDALAEELTKFGKKRAIFDYDPTDEGTHSLSFRLGGGEPSSTRLTTATETVHERDADTVFWRVKPPLKALVAGGTASIDEDFRHREWEKALGALPALLDHARWINPYAPHWLAGNKVRQLQAAQRCGLQVPATVITTCADDVLPLFETGEVIYKTLSHPLYSSRELILTSKITRAELEDRRDMVAVAPCLFQQYAEKAYELRVTIVGTSVIPVRIDSQAHSHTRVDWRIDQLRPELYSVVTLPAAVRRMLLDFMDSLGLVFGAIDLIVTPEGEYLFLEINPGGQWLWMERMIGVPITREIAAFIAGGEPEAFG